MTKNKKLLAKKIKNAGAIFMGKYTPEAFGDYVAGPSHVLPTSGNARFDSGLSVLDFLKRTSYIEANKTGLKNNPAQLSRTDISHLLIQAGVKVS